MADQLPTLRVPEEGLEEMAKLGEFGPDFVVQLADKLRGRELTLQLDGVVKQLASELGKPAEVLEGLLSNLLIPLNFLRQRLGLPPERFVEAVSRSIERDPPEEWTLEDRERWRAVAPHLHLLVEPDTFLALTGKAVDLTMNRSANLRHLQILSELRPVYDDEATDLRALVLTNTLVLRYEQGGRDQRLHLNLDTGSLRLITEELDRARKKNRLAVERTKQWKVPLLSEGELEA
jgi:hypothetical protein